MTVAVNFVAELTLWVNRNYILASGVGAKSESDLGEWVQKVMN